MKDSNLNVLIIDDDQEAIRVLLSVLARRAVRGTVASNLKEALAYLDRARVNLVFCAFQTQRTAEVLRFISEIKNNCPDLPIIMTAKTDWTESEKLQTVLDMTVTYVNAGCRRILMKPFTADDVDNVLDSVLPNNAVSLIADGTKCRCSGIVGKSSKLLEAVDLAKRIANTSMPVLVSGESGTGKELISSLIHYHSSRSAGPYLQVNCAAVNDSLLESELFGHEKGAFTGAIAMRKGRFEMAHGGTLLLDEITETPIKFQSTLLRVLEQQDFERVGGNESVKVDVRIISTTNKNLAREASEGRFRHDLYYRLCGVRVIVPPLRERLEDLPDLIWHFVNMYSGQSGRRITALSEEMMKIFEQYDWPGNIRQLRNVVRTSLALGSGPVLTLADASWMFDELQPRLQKEIQSSQRAVYNNKMPLAELERQAIINTLEYTSGNQTKAAKILGISDRTLRGKIRQYNNECLQSA